jgi:hypothetical protein
MHISKANRMSDEAVAREVQELLEYPLLKVFEIEGFRGRAVVFALLEDATDESVAIHDRLRRVHFHCLGRPSAHYKFAGRRVWLRQVYERLSQWDTRPDSGLAVLEAALPHSEALIKSVQRPESRDRVQQAFLTLGLAPSPSSTRRAGFYAVAVRGHVIFGYSGDVCNRQAAYRSAFKGEPLEWLVWPAVDGESAHAIEYAVKSAFGALPGMERNPMFPAAPGKLYSGSAESVADCSLEEFGAFMSLLLDEAFLECEAARGDRS